MKRIMIIDEEPKFARLIAERLANEGYRTEIYRNSEAIFSYLTRSNSFDLVLLGTTQPHTDSVQLFRRFRKELNCPIIYINAREQGEDINTPPEIDGSDYFVKPMAIDELIARICEHLNSDTAQAIPSISSDVQEIGNLSIDRRMECARLNGQRIRLSSREYQLLCYLADHIGQIVTRDDIAGAVWGEEKHTPTSITVHIKNLRDKFDPDNRFIRTIWGVGYVLVAPNSPHV